MLLTTYNLNKMNTMLPITSTLNILITILFLLRGGTLSLSAPSSLTPRPVAIITGGTRGIGSGIAEVLAEQGYDLLLTYNSNQIAAEELSSTLRNNCCHIECVGGDISLPSVRDDVFRCLNQKFAPDQPLKVLVHNAGQYVGITSDNSDGLTGEKTLSFGDGSLLNNDATTNFDTMHYYQRMYGEAWIDLCERSLARMNSGSSIVGISSPSVFASYYGPDPSYSMPGSGKCVMEYSMRIYALKAAERRINVNIVVPGAVQTPAWKKLAQKRGMKDETELMQRVVDRMIPMKTTLSPRDIGNGVAFLCSDAGRFITGIVFPIDGGQHLKY